MDGGGCAMVGMTGDGELCDGRDEQRYRKLKEVMRWWCS